MNCIFCPNEKVEDVGKGRYFCHHCSQWFFIEDKKPVQEPQVSTAVKEINTVKGLVLELLRIEEKCRNDDKWLTYQVFQTIAVQNGKRIFLPFELFEKFPAFETVKRCRAYIQNFEKKFPPTDEGVIRKRRQREEMFQKEFVHDIR